MTDAQHYPGAELELFRDAIKWKAYLASQIRPFVRGDVLEVGAGLGATTRALYDPSCTSWTCLEPDLEMGRQLPALLADLPRSRGAQPRVVQGSLSDALVEEYFDVILYVDVLEHIKDDKRELEQAASRLGPNGRVVVLSPAMQWLFTPFDESIGHYRRYTKASLREAAPPDLRMVTERYLDAVGVAASLANRLLMRASMPTVTQIRVWDRLMVPMSRVIDPLLFYAIGKSVLTVFEKRPAPGGSSTD